MQDVLYFLPTDPKTILPTRANENDAGLDLYALEDVELRPGEIKRYDVGLKVALSRTQVGLFWDKSGRAWDAKANRPVGLSIIGGCIDGPYRGPLSVVVGNLNTYNTIRHLWLLGTETNRFLLDDSARVALGDTIRIPYGKALTQFIVLDGVRFPKAAFTDDGTWDREFAQTSRGEKGFGSSEEPKGLVHASFTGRIETEVSCIDGPCVGQKVKWPENEEDHQVDGELYKRVPFTYTAIHAENPTSPAYVVEIISGPYKGTNVAVVPKDVLYYKGLRHVRTGPDRLTYRLEQLK